VEREKMESGAGRIDSNVQGEEHESEGGGRHERGTTHHNATAEAKLSLAGQQAPKNLNGRKKKEKGKGEGARAMWNRMQV